MMKSLEAMMIAGLCIMVLGCAFLLATGLKAARHIVGRDLRLTDDRRGAHLDLYMSFFWGGMLLVQVSNILLHTEPGGAYKLSSLTLVATACNIFACGVFAGRLLLRREMRLREEQSHASRAR